MALLLLVDGNPLLRAGVRDLLARDLPPLTRIVESGSAEEAIELCRRLNPDWVLMDIRLGGMDGIEGTRRIVAGNRDARVIMLTEYDDPGYRRAAAEAGAVGYVLKEDLEEVSTLIASPSSSHGRSHM
jgi:DNA-binding NarL/FixJ family response regulator